jgi:uncharacterized membrane protein YhaH (DUF805 family)
MNPFVRPWRHLFDFNGRASRSEYWLFHVGAIVLYFVISLVVGLFFALISLVGGTAAQSRLDNGVAVISVVEFGIFLLVFLIGHLSVTIRRIHDQNEPGIKYLLTFIPLAGFVFWLIFAFTAGTDGENDYGYDPRQPEPAGTDELESVFS